MRTILFCCLGILVLCLSFSILQTRIVEGTVTDHYGNGLAGVKVLEKQSGRSTISRHDGRFKLSVKTADALLVFTAPGYLAVEKRVPKKEAMVIRLNAAGGTQQDTIAQITLPERKTNPPVNPITAGPQLRDVTTSEYLQGITHADAMHSPMLTKRAPYETLHEHEKFSGKTEKYNTEDYDGITENRFVRVANQALSTFSIDVDAASYSNVRRYLREGMLPPPGSVRIEEMINYFSYEYPQPLGEEPFTVNTEVASCPWNPRHQLVLTGLQGKKIPVANLPASNLVFLIDVSGSMQGPNRLPLVKSSMKLLVEQLREQDHVSIVVYAGNAGLVLSPTSGGDKMRIKDAIDRLEAGGSTAGGEGIQLAYRTARDHFKNGGNNRVILCTDGDFNVGESSDASLETLIEKERTSGVYLTVLGFGMGNYKDNKMQKLADKGNGNHAYIDGLNEAKKVLVSEFGGTLFTIAKDVKLQIEFNPARVQAYRLIGYENRMLAAEDFNNDEKDAGELGSGHTVTAIYEVIPAGVKNEFEETVDSLKYQKNTTLVEGHGNELMTIKLRYKKPRDTNSRLMVHPVQHQVKAVTATSANLRFAAAVAEFGMLLRNSHFKQAASFDHALGLANSAVGSDEAGYRKEFLQLIEMASKLAKGDKLMQTKKEFLGSR